MALNAATRLVVGVGIYEHITPALRDVLQWLPVPQRIIIIIAADYLFQQIAVEILGPINESASDFLSLLAKKISQRSGDERETAFLFQRVSALVQRCNSVLLHDSFVREHYSE